jgi:hypothetical protein
MTVLALQVESTDARQSRNLFQTFVSIFSEMTYWYFKSESDESMLECSKTSSPKMRLDIKLDWRDDRLLKMIKIQRRAYNSSESLLHQLRMRPRAGKQPVSHGHD